MACNGCLMLIHKETEENITLKQGHNHQKEINILKQGQTDQIQKEGFEDGKGKTIEHFNL